jgi:sigma54-dependent transcription regulator
MAENELLDVASGKRWGETRNDLRAGMDPDAIAVRAVDELNRGIRRSLVNAQRKGDTLQSLVLAADLGRETMRAAIGRFTDPTLARIVVGAFLKLPGCRDRGTLVDSVTTLIIDRVCDAIVGHAGDSIRYQDAAERQTLRFVLTSKLMSFRRELHSLISNSTAGLPVRLVLRPRATQASKKLRLRIVLEQSLLPGPGSPDHAERRH